MSLIKKSDVKNHLSSRHRTKIQLSEPASLPDATGYSGAEPDATDESPSAFTGDSSAEHTIAVMPAIPASKPADTTDSRVPETSRNARP